MPLRFGSSADFDIWLRMQADTSQAEQGLNRLGAATNEMTAEQFNAYMSTQSLGGGVEELTKQSRELQTNWWRTQRVLRASTFVFQQVGLAGAAMMAPMLLGIKAYLSELEKTEGAVDPIATKWTAAMESMKMSQMRVGRVAMAELLPFLEKAAVLVERVAAYAERHPTQVLNLMKLGASLVAVSAIGMAVTQGIKLIVDIKFVAASTQNLLAARIMERASQKNLAAAGVMSKGGLGKAAGVAGTATIGVVGAAAAAGTVAASEGFMIGKMIREQFGEIANSIFVALAPIIPLIGGLVSTGARLEQQFYEMTKEGTVAHRALEAVAGRTGKFGEKLDDLIHPAQAAEEATNGVGSALDYLTQEAQNAETQLKGMTIFRDLHRELFEAEQDYQLERQRAVSEGNRQISGLYTSFATGSVSAAKEHNQTLAELAADYARESAEATQEHMERRADIVSSASEEIRRIEQDHRREEAKRLAEHNERMLELAADRDALGLVKEQRKFDRETAEADQETNIRIQRIRKDVAMRLQEEDKKYAAEAQKRQAEYLRKVAEEKAQYEADKKRRQTQLAEEIMAQRAAQRQKLADMEQDYQRERERRIVDAYQKIKDLQTASNAERLMRLNYYNIILKDAQAFMAMYQKALQPSGVGGGGINTAAVTGTAGVWIPTRQLGGYVRAGAYQLHEGEFVLAQETTRILERAVGRRLTQTNVVRAMQGSTVTYNDHRRIDSRLSRSDRDAIMHDTVQVILGAL